MTTVSEGLRDLAARVGREASGWGGVRAQTDGVAPGIECAVVEARAGSSICSRSAHAHFTEVGLRWDDALAADMARAYDNFFRAGCGLVR
jgi:hypothetical protein